MKRALLLVAALAGCTPSYGDLPARCDEAPGRCPDGYDCVHGVCALPGDEVPITVTSLTRLRGVDFRVVPQRTTALVTWETYAYGEGEGVVGVRVGGDGTISEPLRLVRDFEADPGAVEPFYDLHPTDDGGLLVAISASPKAEDASFEPRLTVFRASLPPEGREHEGAVSVNAWGEELRMATIGYGAVSSPRLVGRGDRVEVGYFESVAEPGETFGRLAIQALDASGARVGGVRRIRARDGTSIAIGVTGALATEGGTFWVLDDTRPSALLVPDQGCPGEARLEGLAVGVDARDRSLTYLSPGDPAALRRVTIAPSPPAPWGLCMHRPGRDDVALGDLPATRTVPRPVWLGRDGKPALLVTADTGEDATLLTVLEVDEETGSTSLAAVVRRRSWRPLAALGAALVEGRLFLGWAEEGHGGVTIRMAVIPEP